MKNVKHDILQPLLQLFAFVALWSVLMLTSCEEKHHVVTQKSEADSMVNAAYKAHDYERILYLADTLQHKGTLSDQKAFYWRGYAYSRMRKMRLAEMEWKAATSKSIDNIEDLAYYAKTANRLASLLFLKSDFEGTIKVAVHAMKLMDNRDYTDNSDYANLLTFIGNCQLKLGRLQEASSSYSMAYESYLRITASEEPISNISTAIIGMITITDSYAQTGHYTDAYIWTERLDSMLSRYRRHPLADTIFIDKEWARLNYYRGCALEGLNRHEEAAKAYEVAQATQYSKTNDGNIEATNYLMTAKRWEEAAKMFEVLETQLTRYDLKMTLDNIQTYMVPKYMANVGAHRIDSAIATGQRICAMLDSALVWERQNNSLELATIYDTQQKETEILEQRARLSQQRLWMTLATLVLVIVGLTLFIYFRHRAAMRLEIAYRHLEAANARAEESSRMKSDFIQQISHEIRTPLNILSGFAQIITSPDMELDDATRADINRQITENTDRITGMVNKVLELSDAKSQTIIERTDTVTPLEIAVDATDRSGIAKAPHLSYDLQLSPEAKSIKLQTNKTAAVRALSLLLDNARKFTAPPESQQHHDKLQKKNALLFISVVGKQVFFAIEDTGTRIPASEAEHIFEEFIQLDEYYNGTGVGLTIARSLARRIGGDIRLDTAYTAGARFVLTLPYEA